MIQSAEVEFGNQRIDSLTYLLWSHFQSWITEIGDKIRRFLGGVEPLNLGWLTDPLRYLTAVTIRQVISSNLGTARTDILITLSGISDITELKEVIQTVDNLINKLCS